MKDKTADNKTTNGTSILFRLSANMGNELRRVAKMEERSITTVMQRAIRVYFKTEHNIEMAIED
jgi:predicted transcriptional regulator